MSSRKKIKKRGPRLPLEALMRSGDRPHTTKKGKRGYNRKQIKRSLRRLLKDELP